MFKWKGKLPSLWTNSYETNLIPVFFKFFLFSLRRYILNSLFYYIQSYQSKLILLDNISRLKFSFVIVHFRSIKIVHPEHIQVLFLWKFVLIRSKLVLFVFRFTSHPLNYTQAKSKLTLHTIWVYIYSCCCQSLK